MLTLSNSKWLNLSTPWVANLIKSSLTRTFHRFKIRTKVSTVDSMLKTIKSEGPQCLIRITSRSLALLQKITSSLALKMSRVKTIMLVGRFSRIITNKYKINNRKTTGVLELTFSRIKTSDKIKIDNQIMSK